MFTAKDVMALREMSGAGMMDCHYCATKAAACTVLTELVCPDATILVKASRGMALEELVEHLLGITKEA